MQSSNLPDKLPIPFADSGGKNTIPAASQIGVDAGKASLTDGFPPATRTPLAAGGKPPYGLDMNGILYAVSAWTRWQAAGGRVSFDSAFSTAIGGYPRGAVLTSSAGPSRFWVSLVDNNTNNPDSNSSGWVSSSMLFSGQQFVCVSTQNLTVPAWATGCDIIGLWGGGGGGGGGGTGGAAGGGAGGGFASGQFAVTPGASITATVGAGGGAGAVGSNGTSGGLTSFGSFISASGGTPGAGVSTGYGNGGTTPGVGAGGSLQGSGQAGQRGFASRDPLNGDGIVYIGGAGGGTTWGGPTHQSIGQSAWGAWSYGGGGGGGANNSPGAAGAAGIIFGRWVA